MRTIAVSAAAEASQSGRRLMPRLSRSAGASSSAKTTELGRSAKRRRAPRATSGTSGSSTRKVVPGPYGALDADRSAVCVDDRLRRSRGRGPFPRSPCRSPTACGRSARTAAPDPRRRSRSPCPAPRSPRAPRGIDSDVDAAAVGRELDRVRDEIVEQLPDSRGVADDRLGGLRAMSELDACAPPLRAALPGRTGRRAARARPRPSRKMSLPASACATSRRSLTRWSRRSTLRSTICRNSRCSVASWSASSRTSSR